MQNTSNTRSRRISIGQESEQNLKELTELMSKKQGTLLSPRQVLETIIAKELKKMRREVARDYMQN